ncbi:hypothetical protein ACKWTF_016311 [Chironomus riparius]
MFKKMKMHQLAYIFLLMGTCFGDLVNMTCEFVVINPGTLPYISGSHYGCNLIDESFSFDSEPSEVIGEHEDGLQNTEVDVLSIIGKEFYKLPDLSATFSEIVYLTIRGTPLSYLENEHLVPYADKLVYLVVRSSALEIIGKNLLSGLALLKSLDLRDNKIFYIHPEVFGSLIFNSLLFDGNECKSSGVDVGHFEISQSTLPEFITKVKSSSCGSLDPETFVSKFGSTKVEILTSMQALITQAKQIQDLQNTFDSFNTSLANVTDLYTNASLTISTLESEISALNISNEEYKSKYEFANLTLFTLNLTLSNLNVINEELLSNYENASSTITNLESQITTLNASNEDCKSNYESANTTMFTLNLIISNLSASYGELVLNCENANSTILTLESTIMKLNTTNEQCKLKYDNLNQSFNALQLHADELELQIEDLDVKVEKCLDVNGTCRFTNGTNGYTCIAHNITITNLTDTEIVWTGTHNPNTFKDQNVHALILRDLDIQYMPNTIGSTFADIKTIIVRNCGLKRLSSSDFKDLDVLATLEITFNNIETFDLEAFDSLASLETLNLSENKIKSLPSKIFAMLPNLRSLSLDQNELTSIKADYIATSNSIKYFSATNNLISKVESSFVWKLRSATVVNFSGNGCNQIFNSTIGSYITFYSAILSKC